MQREELEKIKDLIDELRTMRQGSLGELTATTPEPSRAFATSFVCRVRTTSLAERCPAGERVAAEEDVASRIAY
jgi:hypothetical protein